MALDPQAQALLDQFAAMGGQALSSMSVADARRSMEILSTMRGTPATPIASAVDRRIPGPAGEIPVRIYTPTAPAPLPLLVPRKPILSSCAPAPAAVERASIEIAKARRKPDPIIRSSLRICPGSASRAAPSFSISFDYAHICAYLQCAYSANNGKRRRSVDILFASAYKLR